MVLPSFSSYSKLLFLGSFHMSWSYTTGNLSNIWRLCHCVSELSFTLQYIPHNQTNISGIIISIINIPFHGTSAKVAVWKKISWVVWCAYCNCLFDVSCIQYRKWSFRVLFVIGFGSFNRVLGIFWQTLWDFTFTVFLRNSRSDWCTEMVLMHYLQEQKID